MGIEVWDVYAFLTQKRLQVRSQDWLVVDVINVETQDLLLVLKSLASIVTSVQAGSNKLLPHAS